MAKLDKDPRPQGIELVRTAELEQLAASISHPDSFKPELLARRYMQSQDLLKSRERGYKKPFFVDVARIISEMHIAHVLEESPLITVDRDILVSRVLRNYQLVFNPDTYGAYVHTFDGIKPSSQPIAELDTIALITEQHMPFVVEVEIGRITKKAGRKNINEMISPRRIALLKDLLRKSSAFGYILVVDPRNVAPETSPFQQQFLEAGGIITPFPLKKNQFTPFIGSVRRRL